MELWLAQSRGEITGGGSYLFSLHQSHTMPGAECVPHPGCAQSRYCSRSTQGAAALQGCRDLDGRHSVSVMPVRIKPGSQEG